jgi:hypothetical protein
MKIILCHRPLLVFEPQRREGREGFFVFFLIGAGGDVVSMLRCLCI